jgi:flagellum-specific ATP synthase
MTPRHSRAATRAGHVGNWLRDCSVALQTPAPLELTGFLTRAAGLVLEASGLKLPVGSTCAVYLPDNNVVEAEVVGFSGEHIYLMPANDVYGLTPGARVVAQHVKLEPLRLGKKPTPRRRASDRGKQIPVGAELLGRVLDGAGRPLDGLVPLVANDTQALHGRPYNPLERSAISEILDVGVRAINALLPIGRGQRMGLFAGSGVGKSVLLGMMARYTSADVTVVGLIGERGREVKEFIEQILGADGLRRSVVVAAPADTSPLMRIQGAAYATAIAEYFRDQGKNVLLIMDSLTRYAMAAREIALAIGEPPATRGYPPSAFAKLPALVERAGTGPAGGGSITAFYTVLTETDDNQDPVAEAARAILDGHIVLSRDLADAGHYPAIDIETSISRVMPSIASEEQIEMARQLKALYARYRRSRDLINVGAYVAGTDPVLDEAIVRMPSIESFLRQDMHNANSVQDCIQQLATLFRQAEHTNTQQAETGKA